MFILISYGLFWISSLHLFIFNNILCLTSNFCHIFQVNQQENGKDFYLPNHEIYQTSDGEQCDISTLQINNGCGEQKLDGSLTNNCFRSQSPFSVKSYCNGSNVSTVDFGDLTRSSFIKPARFVYNERNRVAQSSWVAGGYWHPKQNPGQNETLSRSSSQSSGIGSLTSAAGLQKDFLVSSLPNSR